MTSHILQEMRKTALLHSQEKIKWRLGGDPVAVSFNQKKKE